MNLACFLISPAIRTWLKENISKYDILHLHGFRSYQFSLIRKYAADLPVPYVLQAHGSVRRVESKRLLKLIYDLFWGNRTLKEASKLIALSESESENYLQMGAQGGNIEVIPNGIDTRAHQESICFGNAMQGSIHDLWHSELIEGIRKKTCSGDLDDIEQCRTCNIRYVYPDIPNPVSSVHYDEAAGTGDR